MGAELQIVSNQRQVSQQDTNKIGPQARVAMHFRNVMNSVLQDALDAWGDIWDEFQGSMTHGHLISDEAAARFVPRSGWPELLEKMWILRHHIDYAKRFADGKQ